MTTSRRTRRTLVAVAATGVIGSGAMVPALAQDADDTATDTTDGEVTDRPSSARHGEAQRAFAEALADELDLDVDTVADALAAVRHEHRATVHPFPGGRGGPGGHHAPGDHHAPDGRHGDHARHGHHGPSSDLPDPAA